MTNREKTLSIIVVIVLIAAFFFYGGLGYVQSLIFSPDEELVQDMTVSEPLVSQLEPQPALEPAFVDPIQIPAPEPVLVEVSSSGNNNTDTNVEEFTATEESKAAQRARKKVLANIELKKALSERAEIIALQNQIDRLLVERKEMELNMATAKLEFARTKQSLESQIEQARLSTKIALDNLKNGGSAAVFEPKPIRSAKFLGLLPSGEVILSVQGETMKLLPGQEKNGVKLINISESDQSVKVMVDNVERMFSLGR